MLAYLYAKYLTGLGTGYASAIVEWSQLALRGADQIPTARYPDAMYELHKMSYDAAKSQRDATLSTFNDNPGVKEAEVDYEEWQVRFTEYSKAFEDYCNTEGVTCAERPFDEDKDDKKHRQK